MDLINSSTSNKIAELKLHMRGRDGGIQLD